MRAIVVSEFGGPEVLQVAEVADPEPAAGEVRVRVHAAGINPADTYVRSGAYAMLPDLPYTPGGDAAGVVDAVGDGVAGVGVGDRVYIAGCVGGRLDGCYAEAAVRPAGAVFRLPDTVSYGQGAGVGVPYATAHYALFHRGRGRPGETVFIHGASGAVGVAAIQLARARGLTVVGSAGTAEGRELVCAHGAAHALDHTAAGYMDALDELTAGDGPDLILEMLANVNLAADLDAVARFGRIVVIGNRGTIEINPRAAMMKDADVLGLALWNCADDALAAIHAELGAGLAAGELVPVVGREMALADAAAAHVAVLEPGAHGNIVLVP